MQRVIEPFNHVDVYDARSVRKTDRVEDPRVQENEMRVARARGTHAVTRVYLASTVDESSSGK